MALLALLGLPALPRRTPDAAAPMARVDFGGARIERQPLGPPVSGPRRGELWALLAADGSGALNRGNSVLGAQINRDGAALQADAARLRGTLQRWLDAYAEVGRRADASAVELQRMEQAAAAVGRRSKDRSGEYLRRNSEAYLKAQRAVEDRLRAFAPLEETLRRAVAQVHTISLKQQQLQQARAVQTVQGAVAAEQQRIAERKARVEGLFDVAVNVFKQDWGGLAEQVAEFVVGEAFDAIPTARLDQLQQQLGQAAARLKQLEDQVLLAELEVAAAALREACRHLDDARLDLAAALADLGLAQKTAVEALGESRSTADAAQIVARRAQMLALMARTRQAVEQYRGDAQALLAALARLDGLYRGYPDVVRQTAGVDPAGAYARSLIATTNDNLDVLAAWKAYFEDFRASAQSALHQLAKTGDDGFLRHFDRVPQVLQTALESR